MTKDQIISEIRRRCRSFGVKFELQRRNKVVLGPGLYASGYFDTAETPTLVVARYLDEEAFIGTLLHEYCHATQWVENCDIWREDTKWSSKYSMDDWLNTGRPCTQNMRKTIAVRRDLEADNERRTVRLIQEMEAPIDLQRYIQRANSYIHFYNSIPETNAWYHPDRVPHRVPEVTSMFRSDKIEDDFRRTPKALLKALTACADVREV